MSKAPLPPTFSKEKPRSIPLNKVYVHVGNEKIYFGRGGELVRGGLVREATPDFGPQRDPTERLAWALTQAKNFKPWLFQHPSHVCEDENGEFDDTDGGGRALIAHILGHPSIEAYVSVGVPIAERAARFRAHAHSRVPLGAVQDFLTFVAEGNPRHVAIKEALSPYYTVKKNGVDCINSIAALYAVHDYAEGDTPFNLIRRTAELCSSSWKPLFDDSDEGRRRTIREGYHVTGVLFVAVALVVQALPAVYDDRKLRLWLSKNPPAEIDRQAVEDLQAVAMHSATRAPGLALKLLTQQMAVPLANVIARGYNTRLKEGYAKIALNDISDSAIATHYSKGRTMKPHPQLGVARAR